MSTSAKTAGPASKPHDYKAHFTRTRGKYDTAMERNAALQGAAAKMIAKQQKLQEELDFLLDAIHDVETKARTGDLVFRPIAIPPQRDEPVTVAKPKAPKRARAKPRRQPRASTAAVTEYSDDDVPAQPEHRQDGDAEADHTDADPSVTMQPIDDMTSSTPEHDASAKRPRDDGESPDAHVPDDDHGSPKRPRLYVA